MSGGRYSTGRVPRIRSRAREITSPAGRRSARLPCVQEPWEDPAWLAAAMAWVDDRLTDAGRPRTGEPDQVHVRPWSTAIRVPTAEGDVWFKANTPELRHEALTTLLLSRRCRTASRR